MPPKPKAKEIKEPAKEEKAAAAEAASSGPAGESQTDQAGTSTPAVPEPAATAATAPVKEETKKAEPEKKEKPAKVESKAEPSPAPETKAAEQPAVPAEQKAEAKTKTEAPAKMAEKTETKKEEATPATATMPEKKAEEVKPAKEEPWANEEDEDEKDLEEDVVKVQEEEETKEIPKGRCGLLEKLLSLLKNEGEVNPVLAGYFCKVMQVIIEKRKLDLLEYIFKYREHVDGVLRHCYNRSISDVLSKILSNEDKFITGTTGEEFAEEKREVLEKMVSRMEPTNKLEDITNNCFILCNLVDTKQQLDFFLNPEVIKHIYQIGVSGNQMSLRAALTFFMTLIRTKTSGGASAPTDFFGASSTEPKKEEEIDLSLVVAQSAEYLGKFKAYLEHENPVFCPMRTVV